MVLRTNFNNDLCSNFGEEQMKKVYSVVLASLCLTAVSFAQAPQIVSITPLQNELNTPFDTDISVTFDIDMDEATINSSTFVVNARSTGLHDGIITYDGPEKTATFASSTDFEDGEVVTVVLATGIESSGGIPLENSYAWSFTIIAEEANVNSCRVPAARPEAAV